MALFDHVFNEEPAPASDNRQLPDHLVHEAFGEVNVKRIGDGKLEIEFTILMQPTNKEGWQTGVALDASSSMRQQFGRVVDPRAIPADVIEELKKRGMVIFKNIDGRNVPTLAKEALPWLQENNVTLQKTKNVVEPVAREFITYLASELDEDGGTTVAYWACGKHGDEYEIVGDFTKEECSRLKLAGPQKKSFGNGTCLTPIVKYFVDRFEDARQGMYIFVTDGRIDDMSELMKYSTQLAKEIESGKRNAVKFVLIGLGSQVDVDQLQALDDLETGTDVDLWDHKIAEEMRNILSIFAEVIDESIVIAPQAHIESSSGQSIAKYDSGLRAKVTVTMSDKDEWFELVIGDQRFRQTILFPDDHPES